MQKYRLGRLVKRKQFVAVSYEDGRRHRRSLGTNDKIIAQAAIDKLNAEAERAPGQTVQTLWDAYREEKKGRRISESMVTTAKALRSTFFDREAESIGDATCRGYIEQRAASGRQPGTIWTELNHLRICLSWAVKRGRIARAPFISLPSKPLPRERWLSREEVGRLKNAATAEHIRLFIVLAIATGGRKEALLQLKWEQVDFVRGIIHLNDQKAPHKRKGRASVPMNRTILAALHEARKAALSDYVIEWNGKPVKSVNRSLARTAEKAGLKDVTAHVFRRSAAIWMVSDGISMAMVAQYLGHADDRMTQRAYGRFAPSHMQKAADALDLDFETVEKTA